MKCKKKKCFYIKQSKRRDTISILFQYVDDWDVLAAGEADSLVCVAQGLFEGADAHRGMHDQKRVVPLHIGWVVCF